MLSLSPFASCSCLFVLPLKIDGRVFMCVCARRVILHLSYGSCSLHIRKTIWILYGLFFHSEFVLAPSISGIRRMQQIHSVCGMNPFMLYIFFVLTALPAGILSTQYVLIYSIDDAYYCITLNSAPMINTTQKKLTRNNNKEFFFDRSPQFSR